MTRFMECTDWYNNVPGTRQALIYMLLETKNKQKKLYLKYKTEFMLGGACPFISALGRLRSKDCKFNDVFVA